ncbi:short-chain dehydrogenase/reductase [Rhodococcus tibetensis]|uniref:Short-chain dehydrogenase/reductase n=1 Tax=Rhodococcus tibetensis TaxID=2965064 RepID=A0ABT1QI41_9NOCA|nr:short-chain dehydrogenase/reductase [Rhodococcus sp. FXJ9.536]MCQ4121867.1 short-chain dehydrogenase/reductase [Rhodococcus sp. FXJ9.536]
MNLAGSIVLITGGASGIGAETGRQLAERGARVALLDRDAAAAKATANSYPPPAHGHHLGVDADVSSTESLQRAVELVIAELGGLDVVVANAGIAAAGTVAISDVESLARTIEVNLTGVIRTVHATLPHVTASRGYYLLVSSAAALKNVPGGSSYAASKAGVEAFAGALRLEVAHKGVDVGVAHPAWIRTPMFAAQRQIESVNRSISQLPWPFSAVTDVEDCAAAFAGGITERRRKIYVPRALAAVDKVRGVFTGALWDRILKPRAAVNVPLIEQEIRDGRAAR